MIFHPARIKTRKCRHILAALAFLAILIQSMVPSGFMPSFSSAGKIAVVICSGLGEKTVLMDAPENQQSPAPANHDNQNACPYLAATAPGVLTPPAFILPPVITLFSDFTEVKDLRFVSLYDPSHAPRGPPEYV